MQNNILWLMQLGWMMVFLSCSLGKYGIGKEKFHCDECKNYKSYIRSNWKIDPVGLYYFANSPNCKEMTHGKTGVSYTMIVGRNCLTGVHTDSIRRLFGVPTKEFPNRLDYYMTAKCQGKARGDKPNIPGCIRLQVYFDENKKVVGVGGMTRE